MFTGIIVGIGHIAAIESRGGDCRLKITTDQLSLADTVLGDSIAVNGVCLTAVALAEHHFYADVSNETLSRTTLQSAKVGTAVNLELALTPSSRLGGHIVSGHVDGIATVVDKVADGRSIKFKFKVPENLAKYIAEKGSICINGISLTVNQVDDQHFSVNIVPHTLQQTTLAETHVGSMVNLEVDLLARYLERLMLGNTTTKHQSNITEAFLHNSGFIK